MLKIAPSLPKIMPPSPIVSASNANSSKFLWTDMRRDLNSSGSLAINAIGSFPLRVAPILTSQEASDTTFISSCEIPRVTASIASNSPRISLRTYARSVVFKTIAVLSSLLTVIVPLIKNL